MDCDLEVWSNNGTTVIRPSRNGKLANLCTQTSSGQDKAWVFRYPSEWVDDDGDQRIDHITRGVTCGTLADARRFRQLCTRLGLTVEHVAFYVPISNGPSRSGCFRDKGVFADYHEAEIKMCRFDLPTEEDLRELTG